MEVLNLAASALLNALKQNQIDQSLLISGTDLSMDHLLKLKKKHSWDQFVKMYENCSVLLGHEKTAREIGYQGIYNNDVTSLKKVATGLVDTKAIYWYLAIFASKHLFNECVTFKYTKIKSNHVYMEINIHPDLRDCPLLLETYTYLFENVPTALGLTKAKVTSKISERKGEYDILLTQTSYFKYLYSKLINYTEGYKSSIILMGELEDQSRELEKLVEEKSQLLRILSHDISNQVSVIDFYLNKAMTRGGLNEEDQKHLKIAQKSSGRLCSILKNVQNLEISHLKGVNLEPIDLESIFLSLLDHFAPQLSNKKIVLKCKNNLPNNVTVMAEKNSLEVNVLGNLISNAIKFSPEGSVIVLDASLSQDKVLILVSDNGIGIPPEARKSILTKKIRTSTMGTKGETGTGFGLGIVCNYINLYGGKINVHQNIPNGTVFTIELSAHICHNFLTVHHHSRPELLSHPLEIKPN